MRRSHFFSLLLVVSLLFFFSCGSDKSNKPESGLSDMKVEKDKPTAKKDAANKFENKYLKAVLQPGWEVFDENLDKGLMRIRTKGDTMGSGPTVYFVFHGTIAGHSPCGTNPQDEVKKFAGNYKGTAVQEVTFNNIKYYKTVFDYGGKQAMIQTKLDGSCIHIKLAGKEVLTNSDVPKMLHTVSYKIKKQPDSKSAE